MYKIKIAGSVTLLNHVQDFEIKSIFEYFVLLKILFILPRTSVNNNDNLLIVGFKWLLYIPQRYCVFDVHIKTFLGLPCALDVSTSTYLFYGLGFMLDLENVTGLKKQPYIHKIHLYSLYYVCISFFWVSYTIL